jgi:1,4-dihydroxy-2-naphthoate octaprenyltransferase
MIGGGHFVLTGEWSWSVVLASLPYVLGVTTVIFGKHIDKLDMDQKKGIHTLPVVIGEKASRYAVLAMMIAPYFITAYLIAVKFFTPIMLIAFLAIPTFLQYYPTFLKPKPEQKPEGQPGWPLYFVGYAFYNNRKFGSLFMFGLLIDVLLRVIPFTAELVKNFWG